MKVAWIINHRKIRILDESSEDSITLLYCRDEERYMTTKRLRQKFAEAAAGPTPKEKYTFERMNRAEV